MTAASTRDCRKSTSLFLSSVVRVYPAYPCAFATKPICVAALVARLFTREMKSSLDSILIRILFSFLFIHHLFRMVLIKQYALHEILMTKRQAKKDKKYSKKYLSPFQVYTLLKLLLPRDVYTQDYYRIVYTCWRLRKSQLKILFPERFSFRTPHSIRS